MESAFQTVIGHLDSDRPSGMNFRDIGSLGVACRATRLVVDSLPIWGQAAEKLGWPQPTTPEDRRRIKARVMFLVRWAPRSSGLSARQELSNWVLTGKRERAAIQAWPRMNDQQSLARLLVATPEVATAIIGSRPFQPTPVLLQAAAERGACIGPTLFFGFMSAGDAVCKIAIGHLRQDVVPEERFLSHALTVGAESVVSWSLSGGLQPSSAHILQAARGSSVSIVQLLWKAGARPTDEARTELRNLGTPLALQISIWCDAERGSALGSRPPSSPEGSDGSSDEERPLKRARTE